MKIVFGTLIILQAFTANAQITTITLKAGENIKNLYKEIYRYAQFKDGNVFFKNGDSTKAVLNYNLLIEKFQFIDNNKDTLVIANDSFVKLIKIEGDSYYQKDGCYYELLDDNRSLLLAASQSLKLVDEQKIGAFGIPSSSQTIENNNRLGAIENFRLQLNRDLVFSKERKFYWISINKEIEEAKERNLIKHFWKHKDVIKKYLKQEKINFKNEADLRKLLVYLDNFKMD